MTASLIDDDEDRSEVECDLCEEPVLECDTEEGVCNACLEREHERQEGRYD